MAEYIERKALREAFDNADADIVEEYADGACDWGFGRQNTLEVINSVPAADVAPVRHGRWLPATKWWQGSSAWKQCSECGILHLGKSNFCHNCGTKMDLEVANGEC